jgi:hypothetical protein
MVMLLFLKVNRFTEEMEFIPTNSAEIVPHHTLLAEVVLIMESGIGGIQRIVVPNEALNRRQSFLARHILQ